jgi:hypothetical protein
MRIYNHAGTTAWLNGATTWLSRSDIAELYIVPWDNREYKWIKYTPEVNLEFKKIYSGGSSDSYILFLIADPKVHMGVQHKTSLNPFYPSVLKNKQVHVCFLPKWRRTP